MPDNKAHQGALAIAAAPENADEENGCGGWHQDRDYCIQDGRPAKLAIWGALAIVMSIKITLVSRPQEPTFSGLKSG